MKTESDSDLITNEDLPNTDSIGFLLQTARLRENKDLKEVSNNLRIRQVYLEAIENDQFDDLPGDIYVIGFIKSYSEYLGLDSREIIERYKSEVKNIKTKTELKFPAYIPENGIPGGAVLLLGLVIALIGYGSWYFLSNRSDFVDKRMTDTSRPVSSLNTNKNIVSEKPSGTKRKEKNNVNKENIKTTENKQKVGYNAGEIQKEDINLKSQKLNKKTLEVETIQPRPPESKEINQTAEIKPDHVDKINSSQNLETNSVQGKEKNSAQDQETNSVQGKEKNSAQDQETNSVQGKEPEPTSTITKLSDHLTNQKNKKIENIKEITPSKEKTPITDVIQNTSIQDKSLQPKNARIILEALSDSYIQVRDKNANQLLMTKLLKKGQTYAVPERSGLTLITGNAGALRILVDGIAVPKIGPIGAIRRNVILDPIKLKDGSAVVE